jgi:hypothetical protein
VLQHKCHNLFTEALECFSEDIVAVPARKWQSEDSSKTLSDRLGVHTASLFPFQRKICDAGGGGKGVSFFYQSKTDPGGGTVLLC